MVLMSIRATQFNICFNLKVFIGNGFGCVPPRISETNSDVNCQVWEPIRMQPRVI